MSDPKTNPEMQENTTPETVPETNTEPTEPVSAQPVSRMTGLRAKMRASFRTRTFRAGLYSTFASLIVIAIVAVVVSICNNLPSQYTQLDVSNNQMFTISEQTEEILSKLDKEVTLYLIAQNGQEDATVQMLLNRYTGYSDKITVITKDPVVHPNFASQYTDETIYNNSIIVVCGDRSTYVGYDKIYVADYSNYYTTGTYEMVFAGESELTSAIHYVTSDTLPVIYSLTGHGETALDATIENSIVKQNMKLSSLSLVENEAIPTDASCLLIHNPQRDLSSAECELLREYLKNGGRLAVVTGYNTVGNLTRLKEVLAEYGIESVDACVLESNANQYYSANYNILPTVNSHTITEPLIENKYYILMPFAHGLTVSKDVDTSLKITELLTTSDKAYAKTSGSSNVAKEDGDTTGKFALAVSVEQTVTNGTTQIVWFSSATAFTQSYNEFVAGANGDLFVNAFGWMCDAEEAISIHSKSFATTYLTVTSAQSSSLSFILIGMVPLAFVIAGLAIWLSRRKA